jgi:hypothetical protein
MVTATAITTAPQIVTACKLVNLGFVEPIQNLSLETEHFLFFIWFGMVETQKVQDSVRGKK